MWIIPFKWVALVLFLIFWFKLFFMVINWYIEFALQLFLTKLEYEDYGHHCAFYMRLFNFFPRAIIPTVGNAALNDLKRLQNGGIRRFLPFYTVYDSLRRCFLRPGFFCFLISYLITTNDFSLLPALDYPYFFIHTYPSLFFF
jgi:hypothetical protein